MKHLFIACSLLAIATSAEAQMLKKLKEKVNKTIDKATGGETEAETSSAAASKPAREEDAYCVLIKGQGGDGVVEGVNYSLVYSSAGKLSVVYNESSLSLGNKKGYRLILSERAEGKTQFVVVENGNVIEKSSTVKKQYLGEGVSSEFSVNLSGGDRTEAMKKYVVADSVKHNVPKTSAQTMTVQKIDQKQLDAALAIARQSDDYKNMSAEEKKEFEETVKKGMELNNSMAGQSYSIPASQGGSYSSVSGYRIVIKGKSYGKFMSPPVIEVSADESSFIAVGIDENADPVLYVNGKKTMLDKNKYTGLSGKMLRSPDGKKFVYVETKKLSEAEIEKIYSQPDNIKYSYNIIRPDGSSLLVTDYNASGEFLLTNSGVVVNINKRTGEVYADGKKAGKFQIKDGYSLDTGTLLIGSDINRMAYYDGAEGSINYLDGTVRKLGIMYPTVISENGKNYLSWFRKCGNEVYLAKYEF